MPHQRPPTAMLIPILLAGSLVPLARGTPLESASPMTPATHASQQAGVTARGFSGYDDLGDHFAYGEVVNTLNTPVFDVRLTIEYLDASGRVLATADAAPVFSRVEPRSTAPVAKVLFSAPRGVRGYRVAVTGWSSRQLAERRSLTILTTTRRDGFLGAVVSGRGRNDTGKTVSNVVLAASFRNKAGAVVNVFYDYPVLGVLRPGQTFDFEVETIDDSLGGATVLVQAQGSVGR